MITLPDNRDTAYTSRRARRTALASLLYQAEQRGRQHALEEVRMLAHGQLTPHVIAVQHCLEQAETDSRQVCFQHVHTAQMHTARLLNLVVHLHSVVNDAVLPSGFEQTLREIALSLSAVYPACACHIEVSGHPSPLRDVVQRAFVVVLYNALHNAYRHAHPSSIHVYLQYAPDATILAIADDGRGLTTKAQVSRCGRGLQDMQRVVVAQGGTLAIESVEGKGTQIRATIPHVLQPIELQERRF